MLVSERIGQLFLEGDRLEYTELGGGDRWVVLLHAPFLPRRMHQHLARTLASSGLHVVTLDLLGHGRSDRPADPAVYGTARWAEQVLALMDHLGAGSAVVGGTSLGANVALECAVAAPERVRGLVVEMPVLDRALVPGLAALTSLLVAGRCLPWGVSGLRKVSKAVPRGIVPFWAGVALDAANQRPGPLAAVAHGVLVGRLAPERRQRRGIDVPVLVVAHPVDPLHPLADAVTLSEELPRARLLRARSVLEWRLSPDRLDAEAVGFALECWEDPRDRRGERRARD